MTLGEKQRHFTIMVANLLHYIKIMGYECAFNEASRSDEQAEINALGSEERARLYLLLNANGFGELAKKIANNRKNSGIRNSLHEIRLAIDLLLFKDGVYLTETEDYRDAGEFWEQIGGTWGGRFNDGNHFSLEHNGVK